MPPAKAMINGTNRALHAHDMVLICLSRERGKYVIQNVHGKKIAEAFITSSTPMALARQLANFHGKPVRLKLRAVETCDTEPCEIVVLPTVRSGDKSSVATATIHTAE